MSENDRKNRFTAQRTFARLLIVFLAAILAGCHLLVDPDDGPTSAGNRINFSNLKVGQESRYLYLAGDNYRDQATNDFHYTGDTLVVRITAVTDSGFLVEEFITPGSPIRNTGQSNEWLDSTFPYLLKADAGLLRVVPFEREWLETKLFPGTDALALSPIPDPQIGINGWKTTAPYCECYHQGYAQNVEILGHNYPRLNVVVDDRFMQVDGPGTTYLYSAEDGMVRSTQVSWWTGTGQGWDLLP